MDERSLTQGRIQTRFGKHFPAVSQVILSLNKVKPIVDITDQLSETKLQDCKAFYYSQSLPAHFLKKLISSSTSQLTVTEHQVKIWFQNRVLRYLFVFYFLNLYSFCAHFIVLMEDQFECYYMVCTLKVVEAYVK